MLGRALTSTFWGAIADRYGRKPVIIIGSATMLVIKFVCLKLLCMYILGILIIECLFVYSVVFNTLFGLSVNFWMAITTRFLLGSLNGLLGPIKVFFF